MHSLSALVYLEYDYSRGDNTVSFESAPQIDTKLKKKTCYKTQVFLPVIFIGWSLNSNFAFPFCKIKGSVKL